MINTRKRTTNKTGTQTKTKRIKKRAVFQTQIIKEAEATIVKVQIHIIKIENTTITVMQTQKINTKKTEADTQIKINLIPKTNSTSTKTQTVKIEEVIMIIKTAGKTHKTWQMENNQLKRNSTTLSM